MLILLMYQPKPLPLGSIPVHAAGSFQAHTPEENSAVNNAVMSNRGSLTEDAQNISGVPLVGTSLPGIHGVSSTAVRTYSLGIYPRWRNSYPNGLNAELPRNS